MELFKIDTIDYTNRIVVPSYKVSDMPVSTEWTDSNWTTHRITHARKASGTFTLKFQSPEEFQNFMTIVNSLTRKDGTIRCSLYMNNLNGVKEDIFVYLDFDAANTMPYMGTKDYDGFDVTVKER